MCVKLINPDIDATSTLPGTEAGDSDKEVTNRYGMTNGRRHISVVVPSMCILLARGEVYGQCFCASYVLVCVRVYERVCVHVRVLCARCRNMCPVTTARTGLILTTKTEGFRFFVVWLADTSVAVWALCCFYRTLVRCLYNTFWCPLSLQVNLGDRCPRWDLGVAFVRWCINYVLRCVGMLYDLDNYLWVCACVLFCLRGGRDCSVSLTQKSIRIGKEGRARGGYYVVGSSVGLGACGLYAKT